VLQLLLTSTLSSILNTVFLMSLGLAMFKHFSDIVT